MRLGINLIVKLQLAVNLFCESNLEVCGRWFLINY